jgi:hypothetical protein
MCILDKAHSEPLEAGRVTGQPQTGVPQIEVTPEMIEAGVAVYLEWCPDSGAGDVTDQKMVAEIFSAMAAVSR